MSIIGSISLTNNQDGVYLGKVNLNNMHTQQKQILYTGASNDISGSTNLTYDFLTNILNATNISGTNLTITNINGLPYSTGASLNTTNKEILYTGASNDISGSTNFTYDYTNSRLNTLNISGTNLSITNINGSPYSAGASLNTLSKQILYTGSSLDISGNSIFTYDYSTNMLNVTNISGSKYYVNNLSQYSIPYINASKDLSGNNNLRYIGSTLNCSDISGVNLKITNINGSPFVAPTASYFIPQATNCVKSPGSNFDTSTACSILGGTSNFVQYVQYGMVGGGDTNTLYACNYSTILNGTTNNIGVGVNNSTIINGMQNTINDSGTVILNGDMITSSQAYTVYCDNLTTAKGRQKAMYVVYNSISLYYAYHILVINNVSNAPLTITMMSSPKDGQEIIIKCFLLSTTLGDNIIDFNGQTCFTTLGTSISTIDLGIVNGASYTFIYSSQLAQWMQL